MSNYKRRSREDRIHEIQLAALEVFLEKGYRNTTMEDIINNTSLSKGGFYHYYKNKEDILAALIRAKNYNYLRTKLNVKKDATPEEVCDQLARAFIERMTDQQPQNKLHLMMAMELANGTTSFYDLYHEIERESLNLIIDTIRSVCPDFDPDTNKEALMLLYRINNTLHFVRNLYVPKEDWNVNPKSLYELYREMLKKLISPEEQ